MREGYPVQSGAGRWLHRNIFCDRLSKENEMDVLLSIMAVIAAASCMVALFVSGARDRRRARVEALREKDS